MTDNNTTWDNIPSLEMDDSDMSAGSSNKRSHERLAANGLKKLLPTFAIIPVKLFHSKTGLIEGRLVDISKSGANFAVEKPIPQNELIELLILLGNRKIKCKGMVKWVKQQLNTFNIGVEFMELSPMDSSHIMSLISTYHLTS